MSSMTHKRRRGDTLPAVFRLAFLFSSRMHCRQRRFWYVACVGLTVRVCFGKQSCQGQLSTEDRSSNIRLRMVRWFLQILVDWLLTTGPAMWHRAAIIQTPAPVADVSRFPAGWQLAYSRNRPCSAVCKGVRLLLLQNLGRCLHESTPMNLQSLLCP